MKGFGDEFELHFAARKVDACLIEGIRNCRSNKTTIVAVGDSLLEVVLFLNSTFG
jgi:hypothetical protein